jgi:hypothetical protein
MSPLTFIGRGGLAGAAGGLLSGLVSLVLAEPVIDHAIALEHAKSTEHVEELFTRDVQYVGLLVATVLTGLAIGIIFGAVYAWLHRQDPQTDPWGRALRLSGAGFAGVSLLPFLRYPASPPGSGGPETVTSRTIGWLAAITIGIVTMVVVSLVRRSIAAVHVRQLAMAGVVVLGLAVLFLLPGSTDVSGVPSDLLWTFRLFSLLSTGLIWAGLGVGFGLAGLRSARQEALAVRTA